MHERPRLTPIQINRDLLRSVFETPLIFYVLLLLLLGLVGLGVIAATLLVTYGLGVTGLNHPVFWGFFIINFVFLGRYQPRRHDDLCNSTAYVSRMAPSGSARC